MAASTSRCSRLRQALLFAAMVALVLAASAQAQPTPTADTARLDPLANAINEVQSGNFVYVEQITRIAGQEKAVPILEGLFAHATDDQTKPWIASELVKLGDRDDSYWDFLAAQATDAIENGPPDFMEVDQDGNARQGPSQEFLAWAKEHNDDPKTVAYEAVYPLKFAVLLKTKDPRAIPVLRRGLLARNHMIQASAAMGLMAIQDKDSIPLIVEACKRAPKDMRPAIAISLLTSKDPDAQAAARLFLPEDFFKTKDATKVQP